MVMVPTVPSPSSRADATRLRRMFRYERELRANGVSIIAGVDEVGMSPLAGPVISAAVILPEGFRLIGKYGAGLGFRGFTDLRVDPLQTDVE